MLLFFVRAVMFISIVVSAHTNEWKNTMPLQLFYLFIVSFCVALFVLGNTEKAEIFFYILALVSITINAISFNGKNYDREIGR